MFGTCVVLCPSSVYVHQQQHKQHHTDHLATKHNIIAPLLIIFDNGQDNVITGVCGCVCVWEGAN